MGGAPRLVRAGNHRCGLNADGSQQCPDFLPRWQPGRGTQGQVQASRYPPADGHAADHADGQALTGDHGSHDGQRQDGLDQPLDAPGKVGQPAVATATATATWRTGKLSL